MKKYLILLKPLDWFFFGGEQTHGEEDTTNYFAKSNILPQQTSLLGMLRYQLLKQHNLLSVKPGSEDVKRMNILIGQSSFNMENAIINKKGNGYGKIKKITPVMLGKMNGKLALPDFYYKMPLDARFDIPSFSVDIKACYNGIVRPMIIHDKNTFNHKTYDNLSVLAKCQNR
ncbi:MAG: hypothetical protein LIO97_00980 [Tannerellaceae bacterium]|nr:hypothetical protein [Tannerellaceae bacterium]